MKYSLRGAYLVLLVVTVIIGLAVHLYGGALSAPVRDVAGDALWAAMIFWLVSLVATNAVLAARAAGALAICFAVELGQRIQHPTLDAMRSSALGHLILGSDFDARDLAAYALGVALAVVIDTVLRRWSAS
jgi:hypothetical protein